MSSNDPGIVCLCSCYPHFVLFLVQLRVKYRVFWWRLLSSIWRPIILRVKLLTGMVNPPSLDKFKGHSTIKPVDVLLFSMLYPIFLSQWFALDTPWKSQMATRNLRSGDFSRENHHGLRTPLRVNQSFSIKYWLVVWNMNFIFPYIGNFIIPTDQLIFFRGGEITNQSINLFSSTVFTSIYIVNKG